MTITDLDKYITELEAQQNVLRADFFRVEGALAALRQLKASLNAPAPEAEPTPALEAVGA